MVHIFEFAIYEAKNRLVYPSCVYTVDSTGLQAWDSTVRGFITTGNISKYFNTYKQKYITILIVFCVNSTQVSEANATNPKERTVLTLLRYL